MMKRIPTIALASAIMLASVFPLAPGAVHAESAGSSALSQGMRSDNVTELQRSLSALGYFTYPTFTGYFGTVTSDAVKRFQAAYGFTATGTADTLTQTAIARAIVKKAIVADTSSYTRIPYAWGGSSPSTGFDCSGFVYFMFQKHGVQTQRTTTTELYNSGWKVDRSYLQPGDLVFFATGDPGVVNHVGIYIGNGQFVSSLRSVGIYVQSMDNNSYWTPKYMGAKRIY